MTVSLFSLPGLAICVTFFFAGIIDAVCGGGGLLTLPMFVAAGFPVHYITGTNQCSIFFGSATSLVRFSRGGHIHWKSALLTAPMAIVGASLGARLNMILPEQWLERIMILLVPVIAVVLLLKHNFGSENHIDTLSTRRLAATAAVIGFCVGAYQGFYGAGSGTFFMLAFAILMRLDLITASGNTKLVAFCSVASSAATYILSGMVLWQFALAATVFNVAGSYLGSGLAMRRGARFIRPMFFAVLTLIFIRLLISMLVR